jgi:hypothetical protein
MKIDYIFDPGSSKEDSYLIKDNIFGVFDGYGRDNYRDENGKTGGLLASEIARDTFFKNDKPLKVLAKEANEKIEEEFNRLNLKNHPWSVVWAVGRIKDNSFEWLQLADSLILVIYENGSFKLLVNDYDLDGRILPLWKELAEKKEKNIMQVLRARGVFDKLNSEENKTYGVMNGQKEVFSFIKQGKEDLKNIKHILLFTDGIFLPKEDPDKEDDWHLFVKLFLEGGLKRIKDYVRNIEKDDPYCWKYPRFKQHDDITAISISF